MNIIVLGPQGSGKGTQAEQLAEKHSLFHFEMGAILRDLAQEKSELGKKIDEIVNEKGELVSDDVINEVLKNELEKIPSEKGIVLDGVPRKKEQAVILEKILGDVGRKIDRVFFINISESESLKRISKRWVCERCNVNLIMGKDVKSKNDPCPKCSGEIIKREDDTPEGVKKRLDVFRSETLPVVEYYRGKGLLKEINGERLIDDVFRDIVDEISGSKSCGSTE